MIDVEPRIIDKLKEMYDIRTGPNFVHLHRERGNRFGDVLLTEKNGSYYVGCKVHDTKTDQDILNIGKNFQSNYLRALMCFEHIAWVRVYEHLKN